MQGNKALQRPLCRKATSPTSSSNLPFATKANAIFSVFRDEINGVILSYKAKNDSIYLAKTQNVRREDNRL